MNKQEVIQILQDDIRRYSKKEFPENTESQGLKAVIKHRKEKVEVYQLAISAIEKQMPKKVYHFLDDDTFETTCCGIDVTNKDYKYCPECGCLLGEVEEVEVKDE